jgi:hypothetical protein
MKSEKITVYICLFCVFAALLWLMTLFASKKERMEETPVIGDPSATRPDLVASRIAEATEPVRDVVMPSPFVAEVPSVAAANEGSCPGGLMPTEDGVCVSVIGDRLPKFVYSLASTRPILAATQTRLSGAGLTPAQINAVIADVTNYVTEVTKEYPVDEFVKNVYLDAFGKTLHELSGLRRERFSMRGGINDVRRKVSSAMARTSAILPAIRQFSMRERLTVRKGLHEYFDPTPSTAVDASATSGSIKNPQEADALLQESIKRAIQDGSYSSLGASTLIDPSSECASGSVRDESGNCIAGPSKMTPEELEALRKKAFESGEFSPDAYSLDAPTICSDGTNKLDAGGMCFAPLETVKHDLSQVSYSTAQTIMNTIAPSGECADGTFVGFDTDACYSKVRSATELGLNSNPVPYKPDPNHLNEYNVCEENIILDSIDVCPNAKSQVLDNERFLRSLADTQKHLYDRLFPSA